MRLTKQELDEIRARCEAATSGPWVANAVTRGNTIAVIPAEHEKDQYYIDPWPPSNLVIRNDRENAAFIACARQDVPRLLDEIERLSESLDEWQREYKRWTQVNSANGFKLRPHLDQLEIEIEHLRDQLGASTELCAIREEQLEEEIAYSSKLRENLRKAEPFCRGETLAVMENRCAWTVKKCFVCGAEFVRGFGEHGEDCSFYEEKS